MKDTTWIKNSFIAHRGLHTLDCTVPENSMKAFQLAVKQGYGIEMDINVLKDGTVVVFHDTNLKRMCGVDIQLSDVTFEEIKKYHLKNTEETIHTLKEVLTFIDGQVPLLIELKPLGNYLLLCEKFMEIMKDYQGVWAMHSFHPHTVYWFKKNYPNIIRGQITEFFKDDPKMNPIIKHLMGTLFFNHFTKPDFINYGIKYMPNKHLDKAMKKGVTVIGYASQSQQEFDFVKEHYHNSVFEYFIPKESNC